MNKSPKFPEEISWIVDKNPVTTYLTRRGYKLGTVWRRTGI